MRNRVREVRKSMGWTIRDLQMATGLAHGFLSDVETGKKIPSVLNALKIANALGRTVEYLFPFPDGDDIQLSA